MSIVKNRWGADVESSYDQSLPDAEITDEQYRKLWYSNIAAASFQALTGATLLFLTTRSDSEFTIYSTFPLSAQPDADGNPFVGLNPKEEFKIKIGYLSGAFLLLSCLDHLIVCTLGKGAYERGLAKNYNLFRWIEYMFSASLMRVLIGILSGVLDLQLLIQIFGQTMITMVFGLLFELENSKRRLNEEEGGVKWSLFWIGFIPHFFGWSTVIWYFLFNVLNGDPPGFVYSIIFIIFLLDLTFPIILGLQWMGRGRFRPYVTGEFGFIILSFTSKNLLAWINFFGGNR